MKHQITPWSIYDQQAIKFGSYKDQQRNRKESKNLSLLKQQNFSAIQRKGPFKMKIALQWQKIEKGFNDIVILQLIRKQLQLSSKEQLELPQIRHSVHADQQKMIKERRNKKIQFKLYNSAKEQGKVYSFEHSISQKISVLNVMNYDPFNHGEIVQRGLIQMMKIRQRIKKSLSKGHRSLHKI